ncbi:PaREP1 family protein [Acidianus hospitalis W1]|uniref:PaREP1 family protein n=1 Tax=Acidianus hospitalis (strain W1) TaxID=933801 RepID=F4B604_ACIHW|nr:PaREP1 family protein [Acidianus hospitalis]AEE94502.1 PaREP1 family protein [Acidianus hospitalis W1]
MGEGIVPQIKDLQNYVNFKLEEVIVELNLALELLQRGYTKNASQKAFIAWKAIVSVLVSINLEKMPKNEKEREWYNKVGFLAPTTSLNGIARRLEEIGYKDIIGLNSLALKLHRYAYNGLYRGASDYVDKNDAIEDLKVLIRKITELISSLGKSEDSKKILNKLENINK